MRKLLFAALLCVPLSFASSARATEITVGQSLSPVPGLGWSGTVVADTGWQSFNFGVEPNIGRAREIVVQDSLNSFGAGDLTFLYQVEVTSGLVEEASMTSFAGWRTDVGSAQSEIGGHFDVGNVDPSTVARPSASTISFHFTPTVIGPGDNSWIMVIATNARSFKAGDLSLIDGGVQNMPGFFAPAPEPATVALLLAGAPVGFYWLRRRRPA